MKRIKIIDGVRGIAILIVVIYHYIYGRAVIDSPLANKLIKSITLGWSGVDLFFVLSGFLIVGILLDTKESSSYFKTFYLRRVLRILPLYYVLLILFLILPKLIPNDELFYSEIPFWSFLTFTQNFFMISRDFGIGWMAITWSLAVEEQFYILLPILVWKLDKKKLVHAFLYLIALAPVISLYYSGIGGYIFPLARSNSILMGGLLAIAYRNQRIKDLLAENFNLIMALFIIFIIGAGMITYKEVGVIGNAFTQLWLGVLYTLFLAICTLRPNKILDVLVSNPILIWFGQRSYSIYLFHWLILSLTHYFLLEHTIPIFTNWNEFYITLLAFGITLVFAELSFRFFESFFISYGRKFHYAGTETP
jgi:peptidoglycan/LPS O-acetylase OafA/YrhL